MLDFVRGGSNFFSEALTKTRQEFFNEEMRKCRKMSTREASKCKIDAMQKADKAYQLANPNAPDVVAGKEKAVAGKKAAQDVRDALAVQRKAKTPEELAIAQAALIAAQSAAVAAGATDVSAQFEVQQKRIAENIAASKATKDLITQPETTVTLTFWQRFKLPIIVAGVLIVIGGGVYLIKRRK